MSFGDDLALFKTTVVGRSQAVFLGSVNRLHGSIVDGSEVSGAPGQPRDTGFLAGSWQETYPEEWVGQTATGAEYALPIEHGQQAPYQHHSSGKTVTPRPIQYRSGGGSDSVKLTRAAWPRIVESVVSEVVP
ncbi:MAG: hypothetical protein ACPGVY_11365 [Mycobacterium sp.]